MWRVLLVLLLCSDVGRAGEVLTFNPAKPLLPEPGRRYQLVLHPGKDAAPAIFIFAASDEVLGERDGKSYARIDSLSQQGEGELPFDNSEGDLVTEIADYDNDGYVDFRIKAGWGDVGSSCYDNYYRYDGKKYIFGNRREFSVSIRSSQVRQAALPSARPQNM